MGPSGKGTLAFTEHRTSCLPFSQRSIHKHACLLIFLVHLNASFIRPPEFGSRPRVITPRCLGDTRWPGRCWSAKCVCTHPVSCRAATDTYTIPAARHPDHRVCNPPGLPGEVMAKQARATHSQSALYRPPQSHHSVVTEVCKEPGSTQVSAGTKTGMCHLKQPGCLRDTALANRTAGTQVKCCTGLEPWHYDSKVTATSTRRLCGHP